jgi:hypothetical protein
MPRYDVTTEDLKHRRRLTAGAIAAPVVLSLVPAVITLLLLLVFAGGPPVAAVILFFGVVATALGLIIGSIISAILLQRRAAWTRNMRERIASDGIRAEEIEWFKKELRSSEKRALKAVESNDPLLGDAYRDALASRLTATRIVRSSRRELQLAKRRQGMLKQLKSAQGEDFREETARDIDKISSVAEQAKAMLIESEARLQMIEAAAARGGTIADSELALKRLAARSAELPLALESARLTDEVRRELESEPAIELDPEK